MPSFKKAKVLYWAKGALLSKSELTCMLAQEVSNSPNRAKVKKDFICIKFDLEIRQQKIYQK